jgi:hypothetical protein
MVGLIRLNLVVLWRSSAHWSLVIVCFSFEEESKMQPYILHLDSMKEGHATEKVVQILERYRNHIIFIQSNHKFLPKLSHFKNPTCICTFIMV